jgi:hypothetical protein
LGQLVGVGVLEQEPGCADVEGGQDVLVGVEGREHRHDGWGRQGKQLLQDREAVDVGHPDVEKDDVGPVLANRGNGVPSGRGRDDLDIRRRAQDQAESRADQCFVVHHHHSDRMRAAHGFGWRTRTLKHVTQPSSFSYSEMSTVSSR